MERLQHGYAIDDRDARGLATSEASLLSVVFPARDLRLTLERNLQAGLGAVLLALGVNPELVTREQREMQEVACATTTNRSVI